MNDKFSCLYWARKKHVKKQTESRNGGIEPLGNTRNHELASSQRPHHFYLFCPSFLHFGTFTVVDNQSGTENKTRNKKGEEERRIREPSIETVFDSECSSLMTRN